MSKDEHEKLRNELLGKALENANKGYLMEAENLKKEVENLDKQFDAEKAKTAEINALKEQKIENIIAPTKMEDDKMNAVNVYATEDYKNAFLKHLMGRDREFTKLENDAYTHTTENTGVAVPTTIVNDIWTLIEKQHAILNDVTVYRTGTILTVPVHASIKAGKAAKVAEGVANVDEENEFLSVTLTGHDFSKTVKISYAEANMAIPAFQQYLTNEIAAGLGDAMADDLIGVLGEQINPNNRLTSTTAGEITYKDICKMFAVLKRAKNKILYMTETTLYDYIATMTDTTGRPIFQAAITDGVAGTLLGAPIKIEDSVADGVILVGNSKRIAYNIVTDIMIENDKDTEAHKYIYSGYARGQGRLIDDLSFSTLTVKTA